MTSTYQTDSKTHAEAMEVVARHSGGDPAVMLTTDQMWAVLNEASPKARDYLIGRWSDGHRCFIQNHDGEIERLRRVLEEDHAYWKDGYERDQAEIERLNRVLESVTEIKDRLLEQQYTDHPEVPHP